MNAFTLTEMTDLIGRLDNLSIQATRTLHRQLKALAAHGLLQSCGTRGSGEKAPALFETHEVAKARVISKLLNYDMEVRALRTIFSIADSREAPNELRFASGLENAIAAALKGENPSAHFEILNGDARIRGSFRYEGEEQRSSEADRIIAAHDAATGTRVVGQLSLYLGELVQPLIAEFEEIASAEPNRLPPPPKVG